MQRVLVLVAGLTSSAALDGACPASRVVVAGATGATGRELVVQLAVALLFALKLALTSVGQARGHTVVAVSARAVDHQEWSELTEADRSRVIIHQSDGSLQDLLQTVQGASAVHT